MIAFKNIRKMIKVILVQVNSCLIKYRFSQPWKITKWSINANCKNVSTFYLKDNHVSLKAGKTGIFT